MKELKKHIGLLCDRYIEITEVEQQILYEKEITATAKDLDIKLSHWEQTVKVVGISNKGVVFYNDCNHSIGLSVSIDSSQPYDLKWGEWKKFDRYRRKGSTCLFDYTIYYMPKADVYFMITGAESDISIVKDNAKCLGIPWEDVHEVYDYDIPKDATVYLTTHSIIGILIPQFKTITWEELESIPLDERRVVNNILEIVNNYQQLLTTN
jgi:hypothetical protein